MDTIRGILLCTRDDLSPWKFRASSYEFNLWEKIEPTFWSLCGNHVVFKEDFLSCSLTLKGNTDWVFYHRSREEMFLSISGKADSIDVAARLRALFLLLHNRPVTIEADNEHFKIFAGQNEKE